ncbi:MAG: hypothetical protein J7L79_00555 [Thaumarchaeota archaeon]|nr:hypothetical protein [Nitrososphaerota archaeon]
MWRELGENEALCGNLIRVEDPTIVDTIEEGKILYADEDSRKLFEKCQAMKRVGKLKRTEKSISF